MLILRCLFLTLLFLSTASIAQTIVIPLSEQGQQQISVPKRGMHLNAVVRHFGEPKKRHPAVGQPAITRWDYADFSVYFQGEQVVHSVKNHTPTQTP
ncbi:phosphodiesterase [Pseudomonas sp. F1_0610]|uniref:phosphodiesterase n=1 Tax=Pseudomonas sp. F1_0610 TaxID=3114284 RepID=UPI0039C3A208